MRATKVLFGIGIAIVLAGLASIAPLAYFWNQNRIAVANPAATVVVPAVAPQPAPAPALISGYPIRLQIPSLAVDLQVVDGVYNEKTHAWTLSRDKAHYALPSMLPNNQAGNTLIYGHYRPEVFARLHKLAIGAQVQLTTQNGHSLTYRLRSVETVAPTAVDIFRYEGTPQLTIQTCTGAWMQNRQLFYFDLISAQ